MITGPWIAVAKLLENCSAATKTDTMQSGVKSSQYTYIIVELYLSIFTISTDHQHQL